MKFGGIFKKGSKNAFREDLAVSDPGSEDSWDQLFKKVPQDNSTQAQPAAVLPAVNLANGSTAFNPSSVHLNHVTDSEKDGKGRKSEDKNATLSKNVDVAITSTCKNIKQGLDHGNLQTFNPVTSTPFVREKRAPSFEVSPIISSASGTENNVVQEDASLFIDSTASLVVKRKNPSRHIDAFDQLLDLRKKVGKEATSQFPGILPLKSIMDPADTTRQYAGGLIRGVKTFQEQFSDFVSDDATPLESQKEVPGPAPSPHSPSRGTEKVQESHVVSAPGQNKRNGDKAQESNKKSQKQSLRSSAVGIKGKTQTAQTESMKSVDGNGFHKTNIQKINRSADDTLPIPVCEVPQSDKKSNFQKPAISKTALRNSRSKEIDACDSKSAKMKRSLGIAQKSEEESKAVETPSIPSVGTSNCLVPGETLKNQINDSHLNEVCQEPVKDGNRISGEKTISYQSGFAIQVGNTCLKQSSTFTYALKGKSGSHLPLPNTEVQSEKLPQREDLEEEASEKERQNSPEDVCTNVLTAEEPSSLSPKSKRPDSSVENVDTLNVGCSPAKSPAPSTIEISKKAPSKGELCSKSLADKISNVLEKPTETFGNLNEVVSSSEEENILLRAQSKKLRENQSNLSRVTKSPKIIDTGPLGLNSQFLGKRLRFSATVQSPTKDLTKVVELKEHDAPRGILSSHISLNKSKNTAEHEHDTSLQMARNNLSDSSFEVGVFVSRNPIDLTKTYDDNFELEIMSSSEEECMHFNKKKKHVANSLHNVQEKTKLKKGGPSSSRVKKMRQRKEARIEALLHSNADDSDSESRDITPQTVKDDLGSSKKSHKDQIAPGARRSGQSRKAIRKNEIEMSNKNPTSSQENVVLTESLHLDDNHVLNGQSEEKSQTQKHTFEQTNSQSGSEAKQLSNPDIKRSKRNNAVKILSKKSTKQSTQEKDISPTSSQENFLLIEPLSLNDNHLLNEQPQEKCQTQENAFEQSNSQSGGEAKQLDNLDIKSGRGKRATKVIGKKFARKRSEEKNNCPSMPNKTNGEEVSSNRYSQRVRRPPSMYWLGRKTQITTMHIEEEVLIRNNPGPSQALTDFDMLDYGDDGQKSKGQKRKVLQSKVHKNIKVSKKRKSSESEYSSLNSESQSSSLENLYFASAKKDLGCSKNEVQEFRCVQGRGVKGDILALGVGAKYENVFHKQNQVFYLLEGDISYECSKKKATLASGSFVIVPHDQHFIITNISNSTTKLVVVTCGI